MKFIDMINNNHEDNIIVLCAGSTIKDHLVKIHNLQKRLNRCPIIGVNNITDYIVPSYHLWTNKSRLMEFGHNIDLQSTLLYGCGLKPSVLRDRDCIINYHHNLTEAKCMDTGYYYDYRNDFIQGYFRTAGLLAIYIAHLMKAKNIYVAGMDGYTLNYNGNQHCYGTGYTDDADILTETQKDYEVYSTLYKFQLLGIPFYIITPTVFKQFYSKEFLSDENS